MLYVSWSSYLDIDHRILMSSLSTMPLITIAKSDVISISELHWVWVTQLSEKRLSPQNMMFYEQHWLCVTQLEPPRSTTSVWYTLKHILWEHPWRKTNHSICTTCTIAFLTLFCNHHICAKQLCLIQLSHYCTKHSYKRAAMSIKSTYV